MDIEHSTTEMTPPREQDDYDHLAELRRTVEDQLADVRGLKEQAEIDARAGSDEANQIICYAEGKEEMLEQVLEWIDQECLHPEDDVTTMYGERGPDGALCNRCGKEF